MKLEVNYMESRFHVIPYLTWERFELFSFFYLTFIRLSGYLDFPNNLEDIKHVEFIISFGIFLQ